MIFGKENDMEKFIIYIDGEIFSKRAIAYGETSWHGAMALDRKWDMSDPLYPIAEAYVDGREPKYYSSQGRAEYAMKCLKKDIVHDGMFCRKVTLSDHEVHRIKYPKRKKRYLKKYFRK